MQNTVSVGGNKRGKQPLVALCSGLFLNKFNRSFHFQGVLEFSAELPGGGCLALL